MEKGHNEYMKGYTIENELKLNKIKRIKLN